VLAVDPGSVRVGLARTDESGTLAVPMGTLDAVPAESLVARLAAVAAEIGAAEIAVGHPLRLDGGEGEEARSARALAHQLRQLTGKRVTLVDERLTTVQAERELLATGARRAKRRRHRDETAAALILQQFLAARHG